MSDEHAADKICHLCYSFMAHIQTCDYLLNAISVSLQRIDPSPRLVLSISINPAAEPAHKKARRQSLEGSTAPEWILDPESSKQGK